MTVTGSGVGRYTACAIASIAYSEGVGLVDGNVSRVLARLRRIGADITSPLTTQLTWRLAGDLVDTERPGDFNQSMMELGATVCTPKNPDCGECPLREHCGARDKTQDIENCHLCLTRDQYEPQLGVTNYPRKSKKTVSREQETLVVVVSCEGGENGEKKYLMERRPKTGLLADLLQFPSLELPAGQETKEADKLNLLTEKLTELNISDPVIHRVDDLVHVFSHIKMTYTVYTCHTDQLLDGLLFTEEEFESCGTSTAMKKVFKCFKNQKNLQRKKKKVEKEPDKKQPNIKSFFKVKNC